MLALRRISQREMKSETGGSGTYMVALHIVGNFDLLGIEKAIHTFLLDIRSGE